MSDHPFIPKSNSKIVPPFIPKPKESLEAENASLKAEVERLRKFNDEALAHIAKEERKSRECLDMAQADVERLIKAGDKLVEAIQEMDVIIDMDSEHPEVNAWNAAKEASQA